MTASPEVAGALVGELLEHGLRVRIPVSGTSMGRAIGTGDVVTLQRIPGGAERGDLVMFRSAAGTLILHRVLRVWPDSAGEARYQTRGDANLRLDGIIAAHQILGRVVTVERAGGETLDLDSMGARWRARAVALVQLMVSGVRYKLWRFTRSSRSGGSPTSHD